MEGHAASGQELIPGKDDIPLYEGVAQQLVDDELDGVTGVHAAEEVLDGGVDPLTRSKVPAACVLHGLPGGTAHIVRDSGTVAHFDGELEGRRCGDVDAVLLDDRVAEGTGGGQLEFFRRQVRIHGIDIDGADGGHAEVEKMLDLAFDPLPARVANPLFQGDFHSMGHYGSFSILTVVMGKGISIPCSLKVVRMRVLIRSVTLKRSV
jgi:hypothetical protein